MLALYVLVLFFAEVYDSLATSRPGALVGLSTRTDALSFSLSIASTTCFGDVHAIDQLARAVVTAQMAFNIGFVGVVLASVRPIVTSWTTAVVTSSGAPGDRSGQGRPSRHRDDQGCWQAAHRIRTGPEPTLVAWPR